MYSTRLKYLHASRLVLVSIIFIFGIYSLMIAGPSGWTFARIRFTWLRKNPFGDETRQGSLRSLSEDDDAAVDGEPQITRKLVTSKFANWALCLCHIGVLGMEIQLRRKSAS